MQADRPDLIILDVMMETQTEGFEFARKINDAAPGDPLAGVQRYSHLDAHFRGQHHADQPGA